MNRYSLKKKAIVSMLQLFTIGELLQYIENNHDNPKALSTYSEGNWKSLTTREFMDQVKWTALGLLSLGVKRGEKIGLISIPCARWTIADYAIMAIGAVSVPIFANISNDHFIYEVNQPQITKIFVCGEEQWRLVKAHENLFAVMISLDEGSPDFEALLAKGKEFDLSHPGQYPELLKSLKSSELATIIYTSGSTGVPKGAMHTQRSLVSLLNIENFDWDSKKDSFLSFLPLAHVFARILNFIMTSWGISVYYYNDVKTLGVACKQVHPTILIVVPRLLEKMYAKMWAKVQEGSFIKRMIGTFAFQLAHLEKPSSFLKSIMDKLVYKHLREVLGGNLRVVFCGGAALNPRLYHFFLEAGFPIYEGWGLTEACPATVNQIGKVKVGTVGLPLPGMFVRVGKEGELLVSGAMLMEGYFGEGSVVDQDGWLHTGDKGSIDQEGFVTIIGRIKELFKTSTGEMVAPIPIEQALSKASFVEIPMVIADNRKFVSCLLFPNFDALQRMKKKTGMSHMTDEAFLQSDIIKEEMSKLITTVNGSLNEWERIRDYRIVPYTLSVETGELTPSMKVKREIVEHKFNEQIESMYTKDSA